MTRHPLTASAACIALALGWVTAASAQPAPGSEDCRMPGGCGTSSKPGGVERAPEPQSSSTADDAQPAARSRKKAKKSSAPAKSTTAKRPRAKPGS